MGEFFFLYSYWFKSAVFLLASKWSSFEMIRRWFAFDQTWPIRMQCIANGLWLSLAREVLTMCLNECTITRTGDIYRIELLVAVDSTIVAKNAFELRFTWFSWILFCCESQLLFAFAFDLWWVFVYQCWSVLFCRITHDLWLFFFNHQTSFVPQ